jgi:C-terminal processing protease CtpA/Prc
MSKYRNRINGALLVLGLAAAALAGAAEPSQGGAAEAQARAQADQARAQAEQARAQTERALAEAQQRLDQAAREVAELSTQLGNEASRNVLVLRSGGPRPRALLGVQVTNTPDGKGASVSAVSPGGAAEAAGIKVGDVVTAIGGAELPQGSDASRAVVDRMRELEPGLKVKVTVLRDGRKMDFDVTPRETPTMAFVGRPGIGPTGPMPGGPGTVRRFEFVGPPGGGTAPMPPGFAEWAFDDGSRFGGMEFATLSERLGGYFGVKSGVLVVRAGPADGPWKLQDGDVILSIDGRTPTSAAHASRILRSYQQGEKVKLRIQRDRRAQDLEVVAVGGVRDFRLERRQEPE